MFNILLNLKELSTVKNQLAELDNTSSPSLLNLRTNTVLIADEEAEVRNALSVAVRRWAQEEQRNVEIVTVANGQQAVDYVKDKSPENQPCLAILDLRMPQINGLKSAEIIKNICPQIPIIITTSNHERDENLIQEADDFANINSHMGFIIRTKSCHLLKVALEFEIAKLNIFQEEQLEVDLSLLDNLKDRLGLLLA